MKNITGRCGTSDTVWEAYRQYGMQAEKRLPASRKRMLNLPSGDEYGEEAREHFD